MKKIIVILIVIALTGCGTVGGLVSGVGTDLSKAGEWVKNR